MRRLAVLAGSLLGLELGSQEMRTTRIVVNPAESLYVSVWGSGNNRDAEGAFGPRERLPVVMVPGIWSSAYGFRKVLPGLLGQGVSVIIIEPLGVASSSRRHGADYSMTAQARRIAAALDSLRVREAVFVGQALSTSMLLRMELQSPGRIRGLVSLEGGLNEESATPGLRRGLRIAAFLFRIFPSQALIRNRVRSNLENVSGDRSWITPDVVEGYTEPWRRSISETLGAYRAMASAKESLLLTPRLAEIRFPVDLVLGAAPHYGGVEPDELRPLERNLPRLTITRIPGAGHILSEERPDQVVRAILAMRERVRSR